MCSTTQFLIRPIQSSRLFLKIPKPISSNGLARHDREFQAPHTGDDPRDLSCISSYELFRCST